METPFILSLRKIDPPFNFKYFSNVLLPISTSFHKLVRRKLFSLVEQQIYWASFCCQGRQRGRWEHFRGWFDRAKAAERSDIQIRCQPLDLYHNRVQWQWHSLLWFVPAQPGETSNYIQLRLAFILSQLNQIFPQQWSELVCIDLSRTWSHKDQSHHTHHGN